MLLGPLRQATLTRLIALSSSLAAFNALAENNPYYIGGSMAVTHVSNIFRTTLGQPSNNDNVTSATILAGIDQRLGRQRLYADSSVSSNVYKNNTDLRNTSYNLNAGLEWQTIERLSGLVSYGSNRSLAQFNPGDAPALTKKNVAQLDSAGATVRYGLASLLTLEGSFNHRRRTYTAQEFASSEFSQDASSVGFVYQTSAALSLGLAGRHTAGKYPKYQLTTDGFLPNTFNRNDIDLTSNWIASSISSFNARLSSGRSRNTAVATRNFSGVTGAFSWRWLPSSKLQLNTTFSRDSGTETAFFNVGSTGGLSADNSRIASVLQVRANYALTSKLVFDANAGITKRNLSNSTGASTVSGDDRITTWGLGGKWLVTRSSQLGCQITHDERTGQSVLSLPYKLSSYGCYAQLTLQ